MGVAKHCLAVLLLAALACPCFAAEDLFTIPTRSGVTLSYLLDQDKSAAPKVVVISFVGALGAIGLERRAQKGPVKFGPTANFLVRIRDQMTDAEVADVIVDSPSDQLPGGMSDRFQAAMTSPIGPLASPCLRSPRYRQVPHRAHNMSTGGNRAAFGW